jgi:alginate O-acetyltransferase complex protein AlgI
MVLFISLFPQLIAGPIVRFNEIADRIENREEYETVYNRLLGFFRFIIGLAKKVLIRTFKGISISKYYI